jgi:phage shock protein C
MVLWGGEDDGGGMSTVLQPPETSTYVPPIDGSSRLKPALVRPRKGRRIAGVCVAIAERYGWDPTIVRLVAVLSIFLPGPQVLAYLILWLVIPSDDA